MFNMLFSGAGVVKRFGAIVIVYAAVALVCWPAHARTLSFIATSLILGAALVMLSLIDIETFRLPDAITIPLAIAGCIAVEPTTAEAMAWRIVSAGTGFLAFFLFAKGFAQVRGYPGLGLGDAKLLAASGSWLGMEALPAVVLLACVLALGAAGVAAGAGIKIDLRTRLPFGPFLAVATWIVWFVGPLI